MFYVLERELGSISSFTFWRKLYKSGIRFQLFGDILMNPSGTGNFLSRDFKISKIKNFNSWIIVQVISFSLRMKFVIIKENSLG